MKKTIQIPLLLSLVLMLSGCYQQKDGCLDSYATNFDPTADKSVDCSYPLLQLKWSYTANGSSFQVGDTLLTANDREIILQDFQVLCGQIKMKGPDTTVQLMGQVNARQISNGDTMLAVLRDDVFLLNPSRFTHDVGHYKFEGILQSLDFDLSPTHIQGILPSSLDQENHPLHKAANMGLWEEDHFWGASFQWVQESDTMTRYVALEDLNLPTSLVLDTVLQRAESLTLDLELDLGVWLRTSDLSGSTSQDLIQALQNQWPTAVKIR